MLGVNREERLLLECLSADVDERNLMELDHLTSADWDIIIQQSIRHSVSSLLYRKLRKLDEARIPERALNKLREIFLHIVKRNMCLYHELSKRLQILIDNNILVIVLKGSHLGEMVYGNIGLRTMCDVDLLFKYPEIPRGASVTY